MPTHQKLWKLFEYDPEIDIHSLKLSFVKKLEYNLGKYKDNTYLSDIYRALALTIRDTLVNRWNEIQESYRDRKAKRVYYLSMEFLIGNLLETNLVNMGMRELASEALQEFGYSLSEIAEEEPDAALGNGGLGRLAACFLDSLATLDYPAQGCGIRYEYGIFHQAIRKGFQKEAPDNWLREGTPWEIMRSDLIYPVHFYGHLKEIVSPEGKSSWSWIPGETVLAQAYDILIPGFNTRTVTNLRLWKANADREFNFDYFNHGDYMRAVEDKQKSENITKVLYPNDNISQGKELRLKQEYLLVSATLQDALATFIREEGKNFDRLPERVVFQLNDTHPTLAIPELMRLLMDHHDMDWDAAWAITKECFNYTNHTVMPEALETWSVDILGSLLPRHLDIIFGINYFFLEEQGKKGISMDSLSKMSAVEEGQPKRIRMANLAVIGSKFVNGVAELHTELVKKDLFPDFFRVAPAKFQNKTNGITYRRWLISANPELSKIITERIGKDWHIELSKIRTLEEHASDSEFQQQWRQTKRDNKVRLAGIIEDLCDVRVDPDSLFDVQVKRIHEYKRQLLNVLRLIHDFQRIKSNPKAEYVPRTVIFAGKAAPGYYRAKMIIKLINSLANIINKDPDVRDRLKVVFLPDYRVSLAERIFPASDLSEQISTAGTEASGTGNMKFMLNGAVTVGTMDGANIEIFEEVGEENIYIFGNRVEQIEKLKRDRYNSEKIYESDPILKKVLDPLHSGEFSDGPEYLFRDLFESLTSGGDTYFLLADFHSYIEIQNQISKDYLDQASWTKKSILNTARSGKFSADRTIRQYAQEIWHLESVPQKAPRIRAV